MVASLGKLDDGQVAELKDGWEDLPALLRGESTLPRPVTGHLPGLEPSVPPPPAQWEHVDVRGLRVERTRDFGESYLALALWHQFGCVEPRGLPSVFAVVSQHFAGGRL